MNKNKPQFSRRNILSFSLISALSELSYSQTSSGLSLLTAPSASATNNSNASKDLLNVCFLYVGPVGDGGWSFSHDLGRKYVEKIFGEKIKTSFIENVPESADADLIIDNVVQQGNKLIFATTFGYMEPLLKAALKYPSVRFEHATGYKQAVNLNTYDSRTYEAFYLAGVLAGGMTKTNKLGFVASIPIPETIRNINAFTLGARSVNQSIKTNVYWVNDWFNPEEEKKAASNLHNLNVDILIQNTDSPSVLEYAQEHNLYAIGNDSDMKAYGPKAHLASAVINWGPYYARAIENTIDNKWVGNNNSWWGIKENAVDLFNISSEVPSTIVDKIKLVKMALKEGALSIWKGPCYDNKSNLILKNGVIADDRFLGRMNFYVDGVVGTIPGM
jgi:simple sugar transport system substrate-binding protein